jgi:deoxycytidine triphosphate deaminase
MVIGLDILLERVRKGELIKNLSERELQTPEGAGFDLRVDEVYQVVSGGYLGIEQRETSQVKLLGSYTKQGALELSLLPGEYYLAKLLEEITLDDDMVGFFHPRSTLFRSGVVLETGVHPPGYSGSPTFGLFVGGRYPFVLQLGARVAHFNILRVVGGSSRYKGQWQGGRVATEKRETQV